MADYHIHQRLQNGVAGLNPGISWAEGGADVFSQLNIGKDESILVLDADDPNTQLLLFDRKGINICYGKWDNVGDILPVMHQHNIRIIVCEEGLGHALLTNDSTLQSRFNTLYIQNRKAIFRMK